MTPGGETVNKTKAGNALGSRTSGFGGWERVWSEVDEKFWYTI